MDLGGLLLHQFLKDRYWLVTGDGDWGFPRVRDRLDPWLDGTLESLLL